jgi:prepilin-type N-terminal cleavage/methylation domain-containing protein
MNFFSPAKLNKGFTLIEMMVVISIVGLLAGAIGINAVESGQKSRDAKRQTDLRMVQTAIELYKNKYGRYPAGCRGAGVWSGQQNTNYACPGGSTQYIIGIAPDFIPVLPVDKKLNTLDSGYAYMTNANGTVFKLKAQNTVESENVTFAHPLKACDVRVGSNAAGGLVNGSTNREIVGWCAIDFNSGPGLPNACNTTFGEFSRSYGVWGGFEPKLPFADLNNGNSAVVRNTTDIICR